MEASGDRARITRDPELLAEYARQALGRTIVSAYLDEDQRLRAISLDPVVEQEVSESIAATAEGEYLAMDPTAPTRSSPSLSEQVDAANARGRPPGAAVLQHGSGGTCAALVEQALPQLSVCAYNEIAPGISVETIGVVSA